MSEEARLNQIKRSLNPQNRRRDPLSELRTNLVSKNRKAVKRGGPDQRLFLEAVEANDFLTYLQDKDVGVDFDKVAVPPLPVKLEETEYVKAPVSTARTIRDTYRLWNPQEASSISVWNAVTLQNLQQDRLEASYLAASSERTPGRERIQKALRNKSGQDIDNCVRTVFRYMGGLRHIRGNISVISDCVMSRYWWMGKVIEETCTRLDLEENQAWAILNSRWSVISEFAVRRLTILANPVLMGALIFHLMEKPLDTNTDEQMRALLRRIGMTFSEVNLHSWTVHEVRYALSQGQ